MKWRGHSVPNTWPWTARRFHKKMRRPNLAEELRARRARSHRSHGQTEEGLKKKAIKSQANYRHGQQGVYYLRVPPERQLELLADKAGV